MKLYYPEACKGVGLYQGFRYRYPHVGKGGKLFQDIQMRFFEEAETDSREEADAIVLVNNFTSKLTEDVRDYIDREITAAQALGKPLFLFSCSDFSDTIRFDQRAWVFRYSLYRSTMGPRDICIPMSTEDPPSDLLFLQTKRDRPLVAFCGNGAARSLRWGVGYVLKNAWYECLALFKPALRARKLGVYWRRAMMRACQCSSLVATHFIVRRTFSGHAKTIELDPAQARKEYLETTAQADFVLAPKGDGNYSNRFVKTLAFGRIPVVADTDIVLPLERNIDYDAIMVRVPMSEIERTPELVRAWYDARLPNEWEACQRRAREVFLTRLRIDPFFQFFFESVMPTLSV